jgi:hypothetical protein
MKDSIDIALQHLVGLTFWDLGRAAEMRKFAFGAERQNPRRPTSRVGEWELHVQGAWRLRRGGVVAVGSRDVFDVVDAARGRWDEPMNNVCDIRCREVFSGASPLVTRASVAANGALSIRCADGLVLETWTDSWAGEQWYLFRPGESGVGLYFEVVRGIGRFGEE